MIRLLVVDDSALMRKLLEGIFREEGDFDVRLARDGAEALELVRSFDPQVVTLDVEMPGMSGLSCLGQIMIEAPRPVVMISALTEEGAEVTLQAIDLGAIDFAAKPRGTVSLEIDRLRPLLIEKVRAAANARIRPTLRLKERIQHQLRTAGVPRQPARRVPIPHAMANPDPSGGVVLIGTSTGGPAALDVVLPQLRRGFPLPILVAQHMPANFTGPFARRLNQQCELQVVEVSRPMELQAGTIYIGRGEADLIVASRPNGKTVMSVPAQPDYPWHPSVERMVTSALQNYDPTQLIGVLMTGMGRDGAEAMTRLRTGGGRTIAEAEATAVVWGMPGELVKKGGAELILPLEGIAEAIIELADAHAVR